MKRILVADFLKMVEGIPEEDQDIVICEKHPDEIMIQYYVSDGYLTITKKDEKIIEASFETERDNNCNYFEFIIDTEDNNYLILDEDGSDCDLDFFTNTNEIIIFKNFILDFTSDIINVAVEESNEN